MLSAHEHTSVQETSPTSVFPVAWINWRVTGEPGLGLGSGVRARATGHQRRPTAPPAGGNNGGQWKKNILEPGFTGSTWSGSGSGKAAFV